MSQALKEPVAASSDIALVIAPATALSVLTDQEQFDAFYAKVKKETDAFVPDTTTDKGRKAIAAMAFKVTKTKTAIDDAGKRLTEGWRTQTKQVDDSRRAIREKLDALRDEVRAPLTAWQAAEDERILEVESRLRGIEHSATVWAEDTADAVAARLAELEALDLDAKVFQENLPLAVSARDQAILTLKSMHARLAQEEADRIELARLREAEAARSAKDEADRLAAEVEARQAAEAESARLAEEERQRVAAEAAERARVAEEERARGEQEARDEAARTAQAETERKAQEAQAERDAAHRAEIEELERKAEKERRARESEANTARMIAEENETAAEAQRRADEARTADRAHRSEVMGAAKDAIMELGITEAKAKALVLAIAAGSVPNISIRF